MKEIKLTQGKVAIVDDEDFERLNQFKWYAHKSRHCFYAGRNSIKRKTIKMHREILSIQNSMKIDHRNGNGLDNRKENLRICTNQQNCFNRKHSHKDNNLGIKGVHWNKECNKFLAQIMLSGKKIYLGVFNVLGDADSAYRFAEEKYFREFAR